MYVTLTDEKSCAKPFFVAEPHVTSMWDHFRGFLIMLNLYLSKFADM